jgi:hypothetical protein
VAGQIAERMNASIYISNFFGAAAVLSLLVGYFIWFFRRSRSLLRQWAKKNGFEIVHAKLCWLVQGPFTGLSNKGQTVYRIKVRDHHGQERLGWLLCGGIWSGLFSSQIRVEWDDTNKKEIKEGNQLVLLLLISIIVYALASLFIPNKILEQIFTAICLVFALFCIWRINR